MQIWTQTNGALLALFLKAPPAHDLVPQPFISAFSCATNGSAQARHQLRSKYTAQPLFNLEHPSTQQYDSFVNNLRSSRFRCMPSASIPDYIFTDYSSSRNVSTIATRPQAAPRDVFEGASIEACRDDVSTWQMYLRVFLKPVPSSCSADPGNQSSLISWRRGLGFQKNTPAELLVLNYYSSNVYSSVS